MRSKKVSKSKQEDADGFMIGLHAFETAKPADEMKFRKCRHVCRSSNSERVIASSSFEVWQRSVLRGEDSR